MSWNIFFQESNLFLLILCEIVSERLDDGHLLLGIIFAKLFFCFSITIFEYNPCLCVILPGSNFLAKVSYRNPTKRFQICLKLTLALLTSFGCFFIVNFEHISHLFLVLILMLYSVLMNYIVEWSTDESASSITSSATLDELFECVTTLWRWCLKV